MDDEYIRDIADVIERDLEPGEKKEQSEPKPKRKKGCAAIAMGLEEKQSKKFQEIEEKLLGPPKNVNVQDMEESKE